MRIITTNMFLLREVEMPSIIVLNMTIDGYCLPESKIETIEDLLRFLNRVLDGSAKVCEEGRYFPVCLFCPIIHCSLSNKIPFYPNQLLGGNGFLQCTKRYFYKAKSTVVVRPTNTLYYFSRRIDYFIFFPKYLLKA